MVERRRFRSICRLSPFFISLAGKSFIHVDTTGQGDKVCTLYGRTEEYSCHVLLVNGMIHDKQSRISHLEEGQEGLEGETETPTLDSK